MTVGRESPSDVKLGIGTVSGTHASFEIDADSGCMFVTDLGSVNGTEVDGRGIEPGVPFLLSEGDVVTLGDAHLARYEVVESAAETADALVDAFSGMQEATADAGEKARAVGNAFSAGAERARRARDAIAGVGDVFAGLGGGGGGGGGGGKQKKDDESTAVVLEEEQEEEEQVERVEVVTPSALLDDDEDAAEYSEAIVEEVSSTTSSNSPTSNSSVVMADERVVLLPVGWPGPAVELNPGSPVVLGSGRRRGDADVILTAPGVDSAHASVMRVGGAVYIEDLGSSTGTFVGGRQVRARFIPGCF